MSDHLHVVFDDSVMVAAGRGSPIASRLIDRATPRPGLVCTGLRARLSRPSAYPGTAEHVASLPAFNLLDLDLSAALAVAPDTTWALAHTQHAATPTLDRPDGTLIATADPARWSGQPVRVIDVRSR